MADTSLGQMNTDPRNHVPAPNGRGLLSSLKQASSALTTHEPQRVLVPQNAPELQKASEPLRADERRRAIELRNDRAPERDVPELLYNPEPPCKYVRRNLESPVWVPETPIVTWKNSSPYPGLLVIGALTPATAKNFVMQRRRGGPIWMPAFIEVRTAAGTPAP